MSNIKYLKDCIWPELRQSRGLRIVKYLFTLISAVVLVLWFLTTLSPAYFIANWTMKAKIILCLISTCAALIILLCWVVAGGRRFYERIDIAWRNNERPMIEVSQLCGIGKLFEVDSFRKPFIKEHREAAMKILDAWRLDVERLTKSTAPVPQDSDSQLKQWIVDRLTDLNKSFPKPPTKHE
jgi:hypothetical protein